MRFLLAIALILLFLCEFMFRKKCCYTDTVQQFFLLFAVRQLHDTSISFCSSVSTSVRCSFPGLHTAQMSSDTLPGYPCVVSL